MHQLNNKDRHKYGSRPSSSSSQASDLTATKHGASGQYQHPDDPAPNNLQIVHVQPTDFLMDNMVNSVFQEKNQKKEKERKAHQAALISIPDCLGDFKVLSVEIIDRIFNQLKQMVEEDISDLMRRQRHRDEKWRTIMQPNIVALTNFSHNFNAELADQAMDIKEKQNLQALDQMSQAVQLVEEQSRQNLRAVQDTSAEVIAKEVENRHRHEKWRKELEDEVTKLRYYTFLEINKKM